MFLMISRKPYMFMNCIAPLQTLEAKVSNANVQLNLLSNLSSLKDIFVDKIPFGELTYSANYIELQVVQIRINA